MFLSKVREFFPRFLYRIPMWIRLVLVLWLVTLIFSYFGYSATSKFFNDLFYKVAINERTTTTKLILESLDQELDDQVFFWKSYVASQEVIDLVTKSNRDFSKIENRSSLFKTRDELWTKDGKLKVSWYQDIINNPVSAKLYHFTQGNSLYSRLNLSEIFITNKYGAEIATGGKTTDYYQADEDWWIRAMSDGIYVSDIEFDESTNAYGLTLALRIENNEEAIGAIKVIINFNDIKNQIDNLITNKIQKDFEESWLGTKLITTDKKVLYQRGGISLSEEEEIISDFIENPKDYAIISINRKPVLLNFAHSKGYGLAPPTNWIVITETNLYNLLLPLKAKDRIISTIIITILILCFIVAYIIGFMLKKWTRNLEDVFINISEGNYHTRVPMTTIDMEKINTGINHMVEKLQENQESKRQFFSIIVHELKSPLTNIKWSLELLLEDKKGKLCQSVKEQITGTISSVVKLIASISDILKIIKIEGNNINLQIEHFGVIHEVEQIINNQSNFLLQRNIKITTDFPYQDLIIETDKEIFHQIVENLITNAIKYSHKDSEIKTVITIEGGNFHLSVIDKGIGIPLNQQKNVFGKFFRGQNAVENKIEGTGLGLYLSYENAKSLGGKITFVSKENHGTTFTLTLPLKNK